MTRRIATISHSHPAVRLGGGEVAAHRSFQELLRQGHAATFVGMARDPRAIDALFRSGQRTVENGPSDIIVRCAPFDNFDYEFTDIADEDFLVDLLAGLDAEVFHFHHFWNVGTAVIRRLRALKPDAVFLLTLHEYQVLCAADGQMVKRGSLELCTGGSPVACALCCGDHGPFDYVMRDTKMRRMLSSFDLVLSPSAFLRDRVVSWGFDAGRIAVLENGIPPVPPADGERPPLAARARRFGFFGQATPTKGLNVLVDAAHHLEEAEIPVAVDVHGITLDGFKAFWPDRPVPKTVSFRGRYNPADAIPLMRRFGSVVMPSVWWENSPVVIQEARAAGVPMVASRLGGVFEKTEGWSVHFNPGDAFDLARVMAELAAEPERLEALAAAITPPLGIDGYVAALLDHIDRVLALRTPAADPAEASETAADPATAGGTAGTERTAVSA
jgi:glycosyltransferase involved in cell wall biosynthesis